MSCCKMIVFCVITGNIEQHVPTETSTSRPEVGDILTRLDMWPLRAAIFLLCCAGCWCCNLTKAYVKSKNFFSVLHWEAVDIPGQTVLYSVQYNLYGTLYHPVTWCQNISAPVCDLTDVMSDVSSSVSLKYHVRITVGGLCMGDVKFSPFWQTTLAAPQLSVASNKTHLNVTVSPPMIPWNRSIENVMSRVGVKYTVHLTHPKSEDGKVFEDTSRSVFIRLMETDVQYCGDVVYTLTHPARSIHSESASFCVDDSAPNSRFHILMWPGLLVLLLLIILPITLCQMSIKRKRSLPKVLMLSKNTSRPFCSNPRDDISKVEVWSGFVGNCDPQPIFAQQKSEIGVNVPAYASQEPYRCQQDIPVPDSRESSVHYSLCLPFQSFNGPSSDGRADETSSDSIGAEPVLSISDTERSSETLVVPVRPAENGALQFHGCLFQFDADLSSPDADQETGEQAPLLTDLVHRRNSDYLPVHVSDMVTSNYRQNWLPGIPLEGKQDQRTYILRTDHPQDVTEPEEDFRDGEEPRVGVVILDKWTGLSLSCN
ncbi:interferon lambda receptor 1 [Rhinichthys klamathensis goyatoka]|uniref:interferon lambda receptor 1 n=1 Tax=Rhinichthys klamathensis goyatoka TaxID=3034132 RepID=UPI0024B5D226|nr:interferon lambda receptor 1 [Rhinichthys klamathensis goyatoka]